MRQVVGCMSILCVFGSLVACGQTGALILPSQVKQDKPANYLLYSSKKHTDSSASQRDEQSAASEPSVNP